MSAPVVYRKFCMGCNRSVAPGVPYCTKCGASTVMTDAEQIAEAMVAAQRRERNRPGGCAAMIAGVLLVLLGFGLLLAFPILGLAYFGLLVVVAIFRAASR